MNFNLSEEQLIIQDSVQRFVQENYDLESRQKLAASSLGYSQQHWQTMAELGWLGLNLAEADGGFAGNQIDTMLIMEQFGKGLVLEPFFANCVLGTKAVSEYADPVTKAAVLPKIVSGEVLTSLGYAEEQARFDLHDIITHAQLDGEDFVVNGRKSMVQNGQSADFIVISTRTSGAQVDTQGITLLLLDTTLPGVKITGFPTVDGLRAAEVELKDVRIPVSHLLGTVDQGYHLLQELVTDGILAICAEAIGAMEVLYKDTVEYTSEREQFDHPLADFQVLQHRMVDMFMEYEQCKSLLYRATLEVVQGGGQAQRTVHALKHLVGKTGISIGENAVQLHGGMGMTEELRIGHYFKRLLVIDAQFGNADYHLQQFAA